MQRVRRAIHGTIGALAGVLLCASMAAAGAPALCNASLGGRGAPALANAALGGYPTQFRGTTTVRTWPNCYRGRGGNWNKNCTPCFVSCSRGFIQGGIGYSTCVNVNSGWCSSGCYGGIYPWYYSPYFYGGWGSTYQGGPLFEIDRKVGATPSVVVVFEPKVDEALEAMQAGRFAAARLMYLGRAEDRRAAEESGEETRIDRTDLRLAALAAAGEGRYAEADRLFVEAYAQEPALEQRPLDGATLVGGTRQMRDIVNGSVAYAHKTGTADAWRMVAWLMQGEGRLERARAMMDRADQIAARSNATDAPVEDADKFASVER